MPSSSVRKLVWVGGNRPDADSTFYDVFDGKELVFCADMRQAGPELAGGDVVLIVDGESCDSWSRATATLDHAAPTIVRVAHFRRINETSAEAALAAGFDGVHVSGVREWGRTVRHAYGRADARLRLDAEAEYRGFFDRMAVPAAVLDADGQIVMANRALTRAFGYTTEEIAQLNLVGQAIPESRTADRQAIAGVLRGENDTHSTELLWRRKDGTERWVHLTIFRPGEASKSSGHSFVVLQDITERKHADIALSDRESFFESVFAHAAAGMSVIQMDENSLRVNPALQRLLGIPEQISTDRLMEITHPEDRMADADLFQELAVGDRDSYQIEKRFVRPDDGEIVHGLLTVALRRDESGSPRTIFGTIVDIGDVKRAQQELADAEERLRHVLAVSPTVIYAQRGPVGEASTLWMSQNRESVLGSTGGENVDYGWFRDHVHPDDRPAFDAHHSDGADNRVAEYRFRQEDGSYRWLRDEQRPVEGAVDGVIVVGSLTDVTETKELEGTLRLHERSIRELHRVCSSPDLSSDEKITTLLELGCQRFGVENGLVLRLEEGESMVLDSVISAAGMFSAGDEIALENTYCQVPLNCRAPISVDHVGTSRWKELPAYVNTGLESYLGTPIVVEGDIYGSLCFCGMAPRDKAFSTSDRDFLQLMAQWIGGEIEHKRAEIALQESQRQLAAAQKMEAVGRLTGGIAHDFNNLVMAIRGNVKMILDHHDIPPQILEDLQDIDDASDQTQRLVAQLLAFSRQQVLEPTLVDVNTLIAGMHRMLSRLLGEDIALTMELPDDVCHVLADRGQIEQILMNLVVNARDAIDGSGEIHISTEAVGPTAASIARGRGEHSEVVLRVRDSGRGMDQQTLDKIFEPFFTTKEVGKGTGLGLATLYGIVKQSGGRVEVRSEVGKGTTFEIFLPRSTAHTVETRETADAAPTSSGETILLVEDTAMIRKLTRRMLDSAGYKVLEASGGEEALEICRNYGGEIDLLLTDVAMPGMSGPEVVERAFRVRPGIRTLMMSGYTGEDNAHKIRADELGEVLQKPVEADVLRRRVRQLLDSPSQRSDREPTAAAS